MESWYFCGFLSTDVGGDASVGAGAEGAGVYPNCVPNNIQSEIGFGNMLDKQ